MTYLESVTVARGSGRGHGHHHVARPLPFYIASNLLYIIVYALTPFCIYIQEKLCCEFLYVYIIMLCNVDSGWSAWVVRVGIPQISLSPIPRSQGWACRPSGYFF